MGTVFDLSLVRTLTYFYGTQRYTLRDLAGTAATVMLLLTPLSVGVMFAAFVLLRHSVFAGIPLTDYTIAVVSVPFQMSSNWLVGIFVLGRRLAVSQVAMLGGALVQTGGVILLYLLHRLDVRAVLLLFLAATVIPWVLCMYWAEPFAPMRPRLNRRLLRGVLLFAVRLHVGFIFWFLLLRFDTFLVKVYLGSEAVGRYSLAVLFAQLVSVLPEPLTWAVLPFQSEVELRRAGALTFKAMRFSTAIALLLALGGAATLWRVIPVIYGRSFSGAYLAFVALLPGAIALAAIGPVQNALVRGGRPWTMTSLNLAAFAVNVSLNVVLLKPLGIVGAGVASSIAYFAIAAAFILWAAASWNVSLREAFQPQPGDRATIERLLSRSIPGCLRRS